MTGDAHTGITCSPEKGFFRGLQNRNSAGYSFACLLPILARPIQLAIPGVPRACIDCSGKEVRTARCPLSEV